MGIGVLIGFALIRLISTAVMPFLIALSAPASLNTLAMWRSGGGRGAGPIARIFSGAINTYTGFGGPPVASYLISQGWARGAFMQSALGASYYVPEPARCFAVVTLAAPVYSAITLLD